MYTFASKIIKGLAVVLLLVPCFTNTSSAQDNDSKPALILHAAVPSMPVATPDEGYYYTPQTVTITSANATSIKYTLDNSNPATSGTALIYSGPITISEDTILKAVGINGDGTSPVMTKIYLFVQDTWYLAEGSTSTANNHNFVTYILIQNSNPTATTVEVTYYFDSGSPITVNRTINANTKFSINAANDIGLNKNFSVKIKASQPVFVERSMYWDAGGKRWEGGSDSLGLKNTAGSWFLPEGNTSRAGSLNFNTFLSIANPNATDSLFALTYSIQGGTEIVKYKRVDANSKLTINAQDDIGLDKSFSVKIETYNGTDVVVERTMYWDANGAKWAGGHTASGITASALSWYLPEGNTMPAGGLNFVTYTLIQNPNSTAANVTITYLIEGSANVVKNYVVGANTKFSINAVNEIGANKTFSMNIQSTNNQYIIVERSMYWDAAGVRWAEGHATSAVTATGLNWYLPEGNTSVVGSLNFTTFVLIQNPNSTSSEVTVTYYVQGGNNIVKNYTIPANKKFSINAKNDVGLNKSFAVKIASTNDKPVIVERSMYWDAGGAHWAGGHVTVAVHIPIEEF